MSLFDDECSVDIPVQRYEKGEWKNGRFSAGIDKAFRIRGSVQPFQPSQVEQEFANRRSSELLVVFTEQELLETDETQGQRADVIEHDGRKYEVQRVSKWDETECAHYEVVCARVNPTRGVKS